MLSLEAAVELDTSAKVCPHTLVRHSALRRPRVDGASHAFNKLNDAMTSAQTPNPRKNMILDTMSGGSQYSAIDLMDGFCQILMREGDVPLTAVSMPQ